VSYNVPYATSLNEMNSETLSSVLLAYVSFIKKGNIYPKMVQTFKFAQLCIQQGVVQESSDILKLLLQCFEHIPPFLIHTPPVVLKELLKSIHCFVVAFPVSAKNLVPLFTLFIKLLKPNKLIITSQVYKKDLTDDIHKWLPNHIQLLLHIIYKHKNTKLIGELLSSPDILKQLENYIQKNLPEKVSFACYELLDNLYAVQDETEAIKQKREELKKVIKQKYKNGPTFVKSMKKDEERKKEWIEDIKIEKTSRLRHTVLENSRFTIIN